VRLFLNRISLLSVHKERYSARYLNGPFEEGVALLKQACEKSGADPYDAAIRC
jgi:hypothetical protein